jgi:hypothetical protein
MDKIKEPFDGRKWKQSEVKSEDVIENDIEDDGPEYDCRIINPKQVLDKKIGNEGLKNDSKKSR